MALRIAIIILLIGLTIIAENVNSTEPILLNLTLTTPHADFFSPSDLLKDGESIYFQNATLYLTLTSRI